MKNKYTPEQNKAVDDLMKANEKLRSQHTPTPWVLDESEIIWGPYEGSGLGHPMVTDDPNMSADNKTFIVKAVNRDAAVDELIAVANRVRAVLNDEGKEVLTKAQMEDMLFQAIAKAEGR